MNTGLSSAVVGAVGAGFWELDVALGSVEGEAPDVVSGTVVDGSAEADAGCDEAIFCN